MGAIRRGAARCACERSRSELEANAKRGGSSSEAHLVRDEGGALVGLLLNLEVRHPVVSPPPEEGAVRLEGAEAAHARNQHDHNHNHHQAPGAPGAPGIDVVGNLAWSSQGHK
eukprot:6104695-Pyramimonas_sp.AAC.1